MNDIFEQVLKETTLKKLTEKLIPADNDILDRALESDPELAEFINIPGYLLPKHYHFLVRELNVKNRESSLLDAINMSKAGGYTTLFSTANEKISGFVAYKIKGNSITEVKMFSLRPEISNILLLRDLNTFLTENLRKYKIIEWTAMKENPACEIYEVARIKYKGEKFTWVDPLTNKPDDDVWLYHFEGRK